MFLYLWHQQASNSLLLLLVRDLRSVFPLDKNDKHKLHRLQDDTARSSHSGPPHYFVSIYFHRRFHESDGSKFTSVQNSMEVGGSSFTSMEIDMDLVETDLLPWKLASMEIHRISPVGGSGTFQCFHQLQSPREISVEACMSLHTPRHTSTYFHVYHKLPAASQDFRTRKGSPNSVRSTSMEFSTDCHITVHGSKLTSTEAWRSI